MKRTALFCIATQLFLLPVLPQATAFALPKDVATLQRFVCNTSYTFEKCQQDIAVLRTALAKYPIAQLGNWTWILVRSEDWKAILVPRGLDPDSPAFTYCPKRETFIEEALVREVPGRHRELLLKWKMSNRDLLDFAIGHELGHALCNDRDEWNANRVGKMLRDGKSPSCFSQAQAQQTQSKRTLIGVRLYNDARVPEEQERAAEDVAARVLRRSGIEVEWSDCTVIGGVTRSDSPSCAVPLRSQDLVVYFVDRLEAHFSKVGRNALGYSIIPDTHELASMAYLSYPRIQKLSASTSASAEDLLGLAVAHEIGHLLFGSNQHANQGIMRATWRLRDLEAKAWDEFQFTQNQGKQLRVGVEARRQANQLRAMSQK